MTTTLYLCIALYTLLDDRRGRARVCVCFHFLSFDINMIMHITSFSFKIQTFKLQLTETQI